MSIPDDQQFCLRWNNFQANITSQFETLRDDEDFVDVTLACEGQRLEAHKVVLSACSPFFKELFKSNPCPHPIIFMRDVEARHIVALLEFMYAGEVNVAQAHLSAFLRTAESLQIRGLTDASRAHKENNKGQKSSESSQQSLSSSCHQSSTHNNKSNQQSTSANKSVASSQQESVKSSSKSQHNHSSKSHQRQQSPNGNSQTSGLSPERLRTAPKSESPRSPPNSPPPSKKHKNETTSRHQSSNDLTENNKVNERLNNGSDLSSVAAAAINPFSVHGGLHQHLHSELDLTSDIIEPKVELPDYASDDDMRTESRMTDSILGLEGPNTGHPFASLHGGMEIIPGTSGINMTDVSQDSTQAAIQCDSSRKLHSLDPRPCPACGRVYSNLSNLRQHMRLIHHPQYVTCPLCAKPFKTTLYLKRHLVSFHDSVSADVTVNKTKDSSSSSCTQYSSTPAIQSSVTDIKQSIYGKKTDSELNSANENVDLYNSEQSRAFMDSNAFQQSDTQTTYDLQNLDEFSPNDLGISSINYKE